jgi:S1-C subfamily serine protease
MAPRMLRTNRLVQLLLAVAISGLLVPRAQADIFQYIDGDGVVHYTNQQPRDPNAPTWRRIYSGDWSGNSNACAATAAAWARREKFDYYISEAADLYQLPSSFIYAVIRETSNFNQELVEEVDGSLKGGLLQLSPERAMEMGVMDTFDPRQNILGGARYLRTLANRFDGDLLLTVAAFFAGEDAVAKHNGVPPDESVRTRSKHVLHYYFCFRGTEKSRFTGMLRAPRPAKQRMAPTRLFARLAESVFAVVTKTGRQGSAIVVGEQQLITNAHVVEGQDDVLLVRDSTSLVAHVLQEDTAADRAILVVDPTAKLQVVLGVRGFKRVKVGERVFSLGYPNGNRTFADGLVSGVGFRTDKNGRKLRYLQTSAPISHGSSGGGLFDEAGNLLAVTTLFIHEAQNLNYALAVDEYIASMPSAKRHDRSPVVRDQNSTEATKK